MSKKDEKGFKKGRRPHNAGKGHEFADVSELMRNLGAEKKIVVIDGNEVEMCRVERTFRLLLERALSGNRRDLAYLLRLMIEHPDISGTHRLRQVIFMSETLSRV